MEQIDSSQRGEGWGTAWKKVKGLTKKHTHITRRHRQQYGDSQEVRGPGVGGKSEGRWSCRDFAWGDECTIQCADDVLLSSTRTLYGFANQYPPRNKFNFLKKKLLPSIQDCFLIFFSCGGMDDQLSARLPFLLDCRTSATCLDTSVHGLRKQQAW